MADPVADEAALAAYAETHTPEEVEFARTFLSARAEYVGKVLAARGEDESTADAWAD
jgi:hypothetical protein